MGQFELFIVRKNLVFGRTFFRFFFEVKVRKDVQSQHFEL